MVRYLRLAGFLCAAIPGLALAQAATSAPAKEPGPGAREQNEGKARTLEERVSELKDKIFRTKARLMNLQQMVAGGDGGAAGSRTVLLHRNEMGPSFYLESATYALDGAPVYTKADADGDLERRPEFEIFSGAIAPGSHRVSVQLVYRGNGYGLFSYLAGYKFKVQSSYTFNAEPGKVNTIKVVGFEKGGLVGKLEDRPAVRYDVDVHREEPVLRGKPSAAPEGARR